MVVPKPLPFGMACIGPALIALVLTGCAKRDEAVEATAPVPSVPVEAPAPTVTGNAFSTEVPVAESGGTFEVPVSINDTIVLRFTIDSGASDVSIPADVASTLIRSGTLTRDDFIGTQTYVLADGSTVPSEQFRIRKLKVGTLVLHDVTGSLSHPKGPLLLGQSFLSRLSSWSFDNGRKVLVLKAAPGQAELAQAEPIESAGSIADEEVGRLLSKEDIRDVAGDFHRTLKRSGMTGVTALVEDCYASLPEEESREQRKGAAYCVTLDLVAQRVDAGVRQQFQRQGGRVVPPPEYYEEQNWTARVGKYLSLTTATHELPDETAIRTFVEATERELAERMERQQVER